MSHNGGTHEAVTQVLSASLGTPWIGFFRTLPDSGRSQPCDWRSGYKAITKNQRFGRGKTALFSSYLLVSEDRC